VSPKPPAATNATTPPPLHQVIIEDGSYAYLLEHSPTPLITLGPDITIYVSGWSKTIATGLRVAHLVASTSWRR
jgi:DNA-binding transcriptional MocR family regulator